MGADKKTDFEIGDVEDYGYGKDNKFNHQSLIMECIRKCNEAASHEMRAGWFNEKVDQSGNVSRTYVEDTRKKFISSIKQLKSNIICDFDDEAKKSMEALYEMLEEERDHLLQLQWEWWISLTPKFRAIEEQRGNDIKYKDGFNSNLPWFFKWVELEVEIHRMIFEELIQLTKREEFYEGDSFEA